MLQRIVSIRNVGRFRNCAAAGDVTLRRASLIYAENGRGKTTLCAVLRSLCSNAPDLVLGRATLGGGAAPEVQLLLSEGQNAIFRNGGWNVLYPGIAVFDATYVSENVYAGEVVDTGHRRNLYRVIIGAQGVALANRINELDVEIRARTTEIREARAGLQRYLAERMTIEAFHALPVDDGVDVKFSATLLEQQAAQQLATLLRRTSLRPVPVPAFPAPFAAMLAKTLPEISAEAERMVTEHIARHTDLGAGGERWLSEGLRHIRDDCPFCGQSLDGVELIAAYRGFFSEAYHALRSEVDQLRLTRRYRACGESGSVHRANSPSEHKRC